MKKLVGGAVIAVLAAMAAAGCGSAGSRSPQQAPAAVAQPANPVPILKQTGAKLPPGMRLGDHDAFGDRMAEGKFGKQGWESVTVYTTADDQSLRALLRLPGQQPDDYSGVIVIPARHAVVLASAWEDNGPHWAAGGTPGQIAQRVHGHLIGG